MTPMQYAQIRVTAEVLARAFADSPITMYLVPEGAGADHHDARASSSVACVDALQARRGVGRHRRRHRGGRRRLAAARRVPARAPAARSASCCTCSRSRRSRPARSSKSLRYLRAVEAVHPKDEHWYLATLGVDPPHQGKGYGGRLLDAVLPRADEGGMPTYLETDKERNLAFYARHRFAETDKLTPRRGRRRRPGRCGATPSSRADRPASDR